METINTEMMVQIVDKMGDIIIENEVYFCELDSVAGDGDFGMSVAKGFRQLKTDWEELAKDDIGAFLKDAGMVITEYCGGASGPIWGSAFRAAAKSARGKSEITVAEFADMLEAAVAGIQKRGNAQLGDKTLLDALIPTAVAWRDAAEQGLDAIAAMDAGAKAARDGAEKTKSMTANKGRASYVGERSLEHPDAGAMALGVIFTELHRFVAG
ncbi:dihydroxyacetone kinase subunit DhaL [Reinekea marinisedimentorum]|uniref:Dihydroxyacetone kinase n=1 Tax=Reinekea marinisedimentorum TaxID=230495 RepID=A0A4R3I9S4_9GAMM|nr:dihydroxyacetone kinase subunit DhaL [Reinekea marinisedimentorum]TCS43159.1 dihydroxyacetone kinase [Reinekea marinisedimentorum]